MGGSTSCHNSPSLVPGVTKNKRKGSGPFLTHQLPQRHQCSPTGSKKTKDPVLWGLHSASSFHCYGRVLLWTIESWCEWIKKAKTGSHNLEGKELFLFKANCLKCWEEDGEEYFHGYAGINGDWRNCQTLSITDILPLSSLENPSLLCFSFQYLHSKGLHPTAHGWPRVGRWWGIEEEKEVKQDSIKIIKALTKIERKKMLFLFLAHRTIELLFGKVWWSKS